MKTLTIRNVPKILATAIDREKRRRDTSLNSTVLELLSSSLGVGGTGHRTNGLAELAGTWTAKEFVEFEAAVAPLETVDDDMWA